MEHEVKFSIAKEAVINAILDLEIKKDDYAQDHSTEKIKGKTESRRKCTHWLGVPKGCEVSL